MIRKIIEKNLFFLVVFAGIYGVGLIGVPVTEYSRWTKIGLSVSGIYLLCSFIPLIFNHPVWPHLFEVVIRMVLGAGLFAFIYLFWMPKNQSAVWMFLIYYFMIIFTDILKNLRLRTK